VKTLWQYPRVKRIAADVEHPRARPCSGVQIHELGRSSEMCAEPVSDIVHGQRGDSGLKLQLCGST
jgi:hypothetical protein